MFDFDGLQVLVQGKMVRLELLFMMLVLEIALPGRTLNLVHKVQYYSCSMQLW
jgi:hypothetical protein